jgi:hypothetical protein
VKESLAQGSPYAAVLATGGHGVRMQYDYTQDRAGPSGRVSEKSPRGLRLVRSGDRLTGYASPDGSRWSEVGRVRPAGLARTVRAGLFATSPEAKQDTAAGAGFSPAVATGTFGRPVLTGGWSHKPWQGTQVGGDAGTSGSYTDGTWGGFTRTDGGEFTVTGAGPVPWETDVRVMAGTGLFCAAVTVLALNVGVLLRRSGTAVTLVVASIVLTSSGVLPTGVSHWLLRVTPAAGFAVQQTLPRYAQVLSLYEPSTGYYPLTPWGGLAVLCGYAALAFGLAAVRLCGRDV